MSLINILKLLLIMTENISAEKNQWYFLYSTIMLESPNTKQ